LLQIASKPRTGMSMFFSEIIASVGLILTILMVRKNNNQIPDKAMRGPLIIFF
jgi:glycerol uptake facilitator-like aquaporin